jgi:hypothetical protein
MLGEVMLVVRGMFEPFAHGSIGQALVQRARCKSQ